MQRINSIFLENASSTALIIFGARSAIRRALESYLELDTPASKVVHILHKQESRAFFKNEALHSYGNFEQYLAGLEGLAHVVGSEVEVKCPVNEYNLLPEFSAHFRER